METELFTYRNPVVPKVEEPIISIRNLHKSFEEHDVLKDVNLDVKKGENLVVLGKSGTGKSVLIKCIVGLIHPDSGIVKVKGKNVPDLNDNELNELRQHIGFLFQSAALYDSMSVRENLEFPLVRNKKGHSKHEMSKLIEEALDDVGLLEAIDKMPSELSGGMRKRVGLARTFILKPEIMLYDEPTTGLDPVTSREISELILKMQNKFKTTSIIITHDIPCAEITADRVAILYDGTFKKEGTFDELSRSQEQWIAAFFK
jgi:phospholipid/cholesterol/gamma-HCH transport system ATP-binding protein